MSVKFLSNAVFKVLRNCCEKHFEHSIDQVVSEWHFRKNYHNSGGSRSHSVVLLPLALLKAKESHIYLVWLMKFSMIPPYLCKAEGFPITLT